MVSKCFVYNCQSGSKSCKDKVSLFKCPSDERMLQKWKQFVPQKYRALQSTDRICEKHFESHYVIPRYQQLRGDFYTDLIRPKLKPNAVPTKFPNVEIHHMPIFTPARFPNVDISKLSSNTYNIQTASKLPLNNTYNIQKAFLKQAILPRPRAIITQEHETLLSLFKKELLNKVEVNEQEYVQVCFNCLTEKCKYHTINVVS